jgi:hypothetical protein
MWMRALLLSGACAVCFSGSLRAENNGPAVTVEECWSNWLSDQHLADGFNNKDGRTKPGFRMIRQVPNCEQALDRASREQYIAYGFLRITVMGLGRKK